MKNTINFVGLATAVTTADFNIFFNVFLDTNSSNKKIKRKVNNCCFFTQSELCPTVFKMDNKRCVLIIHLTVIHAYFVRKTFKKFDGLWFKL